MTTGQLITAAREARAMSMGALARAMGRHTSSVCLWEKGERMPQDLDALAAALQTDPDALKGDDYRIHPRRNRRMVPIQPMPEEIKGTDTPDAPPEYIDSKAVIRMIHSKTGRAPNAERLHKFVQEFGLPAYENPLRRNRSGEPTLLFRESEVLAWLDTQIRPVPTLK